MTGATRSPFRAKRSLAAASGVLGLLTLTWRGWIEALFHLDLDRGNGAAEWLIVIGLISVAFLFGALARSERDSVKRAASVDTLITTDGCCCCPIRNTNGVHQRIEVEL